MKKLLIIGVLAIAMVLMLATAAYAGNTEGDFDQSTYPGTDTSVHSGYAASTNACKFCHDVHGNTGYKLFIADNVTDGCAFCHEDALVAGPDVYTTAAPAAEHRVNVATTIPDASSQTPLDADGTTGELGCLDCHDSAPHGAGQGSFFGNTGALISYDDATDYCASCHDDNDGRLAAGVRTSANTHVMADLGAAYTEFGSATTSHAFATSATCLDCHVSAYDAAAGGDEPHASANFKLLKAGSDVSALDTVCRDCHYDAGPPAAGVGIDY